jgi:hypothetical protein
MTDQAHTTAFVDGPDAPGPADDGLADRMRSGMQAFGEWSGLRPDHSHFSLSEELPIAETLEIPREIEIATAITNHRYQQFPTHGSYLESITRPAEAENGLRVLRAGPPDSTLALVWFNGTGRGLDGQSAILAEYLAEVTKQYGIKDTEGRDAQIFIVPTSSRGTKTGLDFHKAWGFAKSGDLDLYVGHDIEGISQITTAQKHPTRLQQVLPAGGSLGGILSLKAGIMLEEDFDTLPSVSIHPSGVKQQGRNEILGALISSNGDTGARLMESEVLPFVVEESRARSLRGQRLARLIGGYLSEPLIQYGHWVNDAREIVPQLLEENQDVVLAISGRDYVSAPDDFADYLARSHFLGQVIDTEQLHDIFGQPETVAAIIGRSILSRSVSLGFAA